MIAYFGKTGKPAFFFQRKVCISTPDYPTLLLPWRVLFYTLKWQWGHQKWTTAIKIECCSGKRGLWRHAQWPWWKHTCAIIFCWMEQPTCPELLLKRRFPLESLHQLSQLLGAQGQDALYTFVTLRCILYKNWVMSSVFYCCPIYLYTQHTHIWQVLQNIK